MRGFHIDIIQPPLESINWRKLSLGRLKDSFELGFLLILQRLRKVVFQDPCSSLPGKKNRIFRISASILLRSQLREAQASQVIARVPVP